MDPKYDEQNQMTQPSMPTTTGSPQPQPTMMASSASGPGAMPNLGSQSATPMSSNQMSQPVYKPVVDSMSNPKTSYAMPMKPKKSRVKMLLIVSLIIVAVVAVAVVLWAFVFTGASS